MPPRKLQPRVPLDLETICLKGLAKEPARRYESAQALADDLRRYQEGQPIQARPVAWPERVVKWVKRRPAVALLTVAVVLVVVGSIAGLTVLYLHAERQRRLAERQEAGAWAITRFFEDKVLAVARPNALEGGAGYDVSLREALDQAAAKIEEAFVGQPEREAAVRNTIGMTSWHLGHFDSANLHLEKACQLRCECFGLEFTRKAGHKAGRAPTEDNLLVFYLPDETDWIAAVARMEQAGYKAVTAFNSYWDRNGQTLEGPDGYRAVLQNAAWGA